MKQEIRVLNLIRGIAALIVIISHYSNATKLFDKLLGSGAGHIGVMLFFVLSGFLIALLYIKKPFNKSQFNNYLVSRIARVIPLYFFIVVLSYIIYQFLGQSAFYQIENIGLLFTHLIMINGISVLWTIPVEIQYYSIFLGLWFIYCKFQKIIFISIIIIVLSILSEPLKLVLLNQTIQLEIIKATPYFIMGSIFGLMYDSWSPPKSFISSWWGLSIILVFVLYPQIHSYIFNRTINLWSDLLVLFNVCIFFFCWVFLTPENSKIYSNRIGDYLGKISYSMYLWHLPILYGLKSVARDYNLAFFPIFLFLVIVASTLSYIAIEKPTKKFIKSRFLSAN